MRRLRTEHQRMLGNGLVQPTRPARLPLRITLRDRVHFATTIEFAPTLQRQHDHAVDHDQPQRAALFSGLLQRLHQDNPT
jgi:hypothetical protein